jgi:hypothetical protein
MKDSMSERLKAAGMSDQDRVFYMLHGHYDIKDYAGTSLDPNDSVVYATSGKLRRATVVGATWEAETKRFRLTILTDHGRTMYIDPKRCVKI